ncbi:hypothetical protein K8S19_00875, partial [bacterium]|nr:hypothetical protein [bacterium]
MTKAGDEKVYMKIKGNDPKNSYGAVYRRVVFDPAKMRYMEVNVDQMSNLAYGYVTLIDVQTGQSFKLNPTIVEGFNLYDLQTILPEEIRSGAREFVVELGVETKGQYGFNSHAQMVANARLMSTANPQLVTGGYVQFPSFEGSRYMYKEVGLEGPGKVLPGVGPAANVIGKPSSVEYGVDVNPATTGKAPWHGLYGSVLDADPNQYTQVGGKKQSVAPGYYYYFLDMGMGYGPDINFGYTTLTPNREPRFHGVKRLSSMVDFFQVSDPELIGDSLGKKHNLVYLLRKIVSQPERYRVGVVMTHPNESRYDTLLAMAGWKRMGRMANGAVLWSPNREIPSLNKNQFNPSIAERLGFGEKSNIPRHEMRLPAVFLAAEIAIGTGLVVAMVFFLRGLEVFVRLGQVLGRLLRRALGIRDNRENVFRRISNIWNFWRTEGNFWQRTATRVVNLAFFPFTAPIKFMRFMFNARSMTIAAFWLLAVGINMAHRSVNLIYDKPAYDRFKFNYMLYAPGENYDYRWDMRQVYYQQLWFTAEAFVDRLLGKEVPQIRELVETDKFNFVTIERFTTAVNRDLKLYLGNEFKEISMEEMANITRNMGHDNMTDFFRGWHYSTLLEFMSAYQHILRQAQPEKILPYDAEASLSDLDTRSASMVDLASALSQDLTTRNGLGLLTYEVTESDLRRILNKIGHADAGEITTYQDLYNIVLNIGGSYLYKNISTSAVYGEDRRFIMIPFINERNYMKLLSDTDIEVLRYVAVNKFGYHNVNEYLANIAPDENVQDTIAGWKTMFAREIKSAGVTTSRARRAFVQGRQPVTPGDTGIDRKQEVLRTEADREREQEVQPEQERQSKPGGKEHPFRALWGYISSGISGVVAIGLIGMGAYLGLGMENSLPALAGMAVSAFSGVYLAIGAIGFLRTGQAVRNAMLESSLKSYWQTKAATEHKNFDELRKDVQAYQTWQNTLNRADLRQMRSQARNDAIAWSNGII